LSLDAGSGRTSSPSAIAVDVHVTLPKSGPAPRQTLRPNVVKGLQKSGNGLLQSGKQKGGDKGQRNETSRRPRAKGGVGRLREESETTDPRMPWAPRTGWAGPGGERVPVAGSVRSQLSVPLASSFQMGVRVLGIRERRAK
jgi:hypothetical protein